MRPPLEVVPSAIRVIQNGMQDRIHVGAQVYVSLQGQTVTDFGIGEARYGVPMTSETLMLWLCMTKPVGAIAIAQLWEQGKLDIEMPIAQIIPDFACKGKERVNIRHILTHTCGLITSGIDWKRMPHEEIMDRICDSGMELNWQPGWRARYHFLSSWYVIADIVQRLSGMQYRQYVRQRIFEPVGMHNCWIGMTREKYQEYGQQIGVMHKAGHSGRPRPSGEDNEDSAFAGFPGAGGYGPVRELVRLFETLYFRGDRYGVRILYPQTIEALTARHRAGIVDETYNHIIDWGLGFILNSNFYGADTVPYGYGLHASTRTYGHGGRQSSTVFCDPEYGLVAGVIFNGTPNEARHSRRVREFCTALYEDLNLTHRKQVDIAPSQAGQGEEDVDVDEPADHSEK